MTQRTRSGGSPNAAAMAGKATLMIESSEMTPAPAAAIQRVTAGMMARHGPEARRNERAHLDGHARQNRGRDGQPRREGVRDAMAHRNARGCLRRDDQAHAAARRHHRRHDGGDAPPRGHAGRDDGARKGHAARDRRPPLPVLRGGVGREGQDRRRPARALRHPESREVPRAYTEEGPDLMPTQLNRAVVGKEFPPYAVTVERGKIKEFARAIGDPSPFYLDDRVGAASEWHDIIAPPTFATTFRDERLDYNAFLRELGTDISRVLHGEQEFEIHRPLQPGRTYLCRAKVVDVNVGDALPPLVKGPIQQIQLTRYAGASGDFNPIHQDDEFAKAAGMGGVL